MSFLRRVAQKIGRRRKAADEPLLLMTAAKRIVELENNESRPPLLVCDGVLSDGTHSLFRAWKTQPVTIRQYELHDVILDRSLMVFIQNGRPIVDTSYLQAPDLVTNLTIRPQDLVLAPRGQTVMAATFDHWHKNYYHWLAHTVPTLFTLRTQNFKGNLILPPVYPWQEEMLRAEKFAFQNQEIVQDGKQYCFKRALYTDYVRGTADFAVSPISAAAYRALAKEMGITGHEPQDLELFIRRGDATNRSMSNESELTDALARLGLTVVSPETLSVREQVHLFAQARLVVGSLGAGMANLAWCRPGTVVCELVPEHHQNPCTLALATQMGLRYWGELVETGIDTENHVSISLKPFDVAAITHRVQQLSAYARQYAVRGEGAE